MDGSMLKKVVFLGSQETIKIKMGKKMKENMEGIKKKMNENKE